MFSRKNLGAISLILLLILTQSILRLPWLGLFAGGLTLFLLNDALRTERLSIPGWLIGLSGFAFLSTSLFYAASVPTWLLGAISIMLLLPLALKPTFRWRFPAFKLAALIPALPSVAFFAALIGILLNSPITSAVRSPFDVIPTEVLWLLAGQVAWSLLLAIRGYSDKVQIAAAASFLLSFASVLRVAYPIGFGFDPFIHRATMSYIAEFSTISPKPLYYIGNYMLELAATELLHLPQRFVNDWLAPVLGISTFLAALQRFTAASNARRGIIAALLAPLSALLVSTPQSLAYFLSGSAFLLGGAYLLSRKPADRRGSILLALFAAIVHPLAGIPALLFSLYLYIDTWKWARIPFALGAAISMPSIFLLQSALLGNAIGVSFNLAALSELVPSFARQYTTFLNLILVFSPAFTILIIALAAAGFWSLRRERGGIVLAILPILLFVNYVLIRVFLSFDFLIEYEASQFADRLLVLTGFGLLPLSATGAERVLDALRTHHQRLAFAAVFILCVIASSYTSLPRNDAAVRGRGLNVSMTDIETVYAIDEVGVQNTYAVLASQMTSVAALQELGFATYFKDSIFYYPIPTGGPLYQIFLEFVEESPTLTAIQKAKDLTGADEIFVVINDYWWNAEATIEKAKLIADSWFAIEGDSTNHVFHFVE